MPISPSTTAEKDLISNRLIDYNLEFITANRDDYLLPLSFNIKSETGEIIAGLNGCIYIKATAFISHLWVDKNHRGKDYGSMLLKHAEIEAKKQGASLIYLDTLDFQAKDFYLKHGYEEFALLEACPVPGHRAHFMKKSL